MWSTFYYSAILKFDSRLQHYQFILFIILFIPHICVCIYKCACKYMVCFDYSEKYWEDSKIKSLMRSLPIENDCEQFAVYHLWLVITILGSKDYRTFSSPQKVLSPPPFIGVINCMYNFFAIFFN